jgi:hypothetical protein
VVQSAAGAAVELNNYSLNFRGAAVKDGVALADLGALGISNRALVDEWKISARSFIGFQDNDSNGSISAGDTFDDYIAFTVDAFKRANGADITPLRYGGGDERTHQITGLVHMQGIQTGANNFSITNIVDFNLYFDAGDSLDPSLGPTGAVDYVFTPGDFSDLDTFDDSALVESASLIAGAGTNTGPLLPTGVLNLILGLTDHLDDPADFEFGFLDGTGAPLPVSVHNFVFGVVDSQNLLDSIVVASALGTKFGFDPGTHSPPPEGLYTGSADFDFGFTTTSEGSLNKALLAVPEPSSIAIWVIGLAAGVVYSGRAVRNRVK